MQFDREDEGKAKDNDSSNGSLDNNLQLDIEKLGSLSEMADKTVLERAPKMTIL